MRDGIHQHGRLVLGIVALLGLVGCADTRPAKISDKPFAGIAITLEDVGWKGSIVTENFARAKGDERSHDLISDLKPYLDGKPRDRVVATNIAHCTVMLTGPGGRTMIRCGEPPWDLRTTVNRPGHYEIDLVHEGDVVSLTEIDLTATGTYHLVITLTANKIIRRLVDFTPY